MEIKDLEDSSIILGKIVACSVDKEVSFEREKSKENIRLLSKRPFLAYVYSDHLCKDQHCLRVCFPKEL